MYLNIAVTDDLTGTLSLTSPIILAKALEQVPLVGRVSLSYHPLLSLEGVYTQRDAPCMHQVSHCNSLTLPFNNYLTLALQPA